MLICNGQACSSHDLNLWIGRGNAILYASLTHRKVFERVNKCCRGRNTMSFSGHSYIVIIPSPWNLFAWKAVDFVLVSPQVRAKKCSIGQNDKVILSSPEIPTKMGSKGFSCNATHPQPSCSTVGRVKIQTPKNWINLLLALHFSRFRLSQDLGVWDPPGLFQMFSYPDKWPAVKEIAFKISAWKHCYIFVHSMNDVNDDDDYEDFQTAVQNQLSSQLAPLPPQNHETYQKNANTEFLQFFGAMQHQLVCVSGYNNRSKIKIAEFHNLGSQKVSFASRTIPVLLTLQTGSFL